MLNACRGHDRSGNPVKEFALIKSGLQQCIAEELPAARVFISKLLRNCSGERVKPPKNNYFLGVSFRISSKYFQNFWVEEMLARSSGECAPLMVGPKEIMSRPCSLSPRMPHSSPA